MYTSSIVLVLVPATISFIIGIAITPILSYYLYKSRAWKKQPGKLSLDGTPATEFNTIHRDAEVRAPRFGGIVVWGSTFLTTVGIFILAVFFDTDTLREFNFLSRSETWVPLAALMAGAACGFVDDLLMIRPEARGLPLRWRLLIVLVLSALGGLWFYDKLAVTTVSFFNFAPIEIGWLIVPLFVLVSLALYASGVIDGIDGLSGGVFAAVFAAYTIIAYSQDQIDLAAFCASIAGGLLAFLWFNIPPARFYMSDTGTMALTLCLAVVSFMTDVLGGGIGVSVLPIIGAVLFATVASNVLQVFWKRFFHRKLFRIAPLHHHFEAIGWPGYKVVMRYWVLSIILAFLGVIIALSAHA